MTAAEATRAFDELAKRAHRKIELRLVTSPNPRIDSRCRFCQKTATTLIGEASDENGDDDEPDDDGHMAVGHGTTEAEAIRDLIDSHPRSGNPCPSCGKPFFDGDTCTMGGCPNGGDF